MAKILIIIVILEKIPQIIEQIFYLWFSIRKITIINIERNYEN